MNDTGGGVTAIHDVPGDITRIGFHWMLLFFLSVTRRGFFCFVFTRSVSEVTGFFFVPNFRIFEFFSSHGLSRKVMDFFVPIFFLVPNLRICELFLHTDCRGIIFFITRLVLGPTDQREVIIELSNIFHTECRGGHGFFLSRDLSLDPLTNGR